MMKYIRIGLISIIIFLFFLSGCTKRNTVHIKSKASIIYANKDIIYDYKNGQSKELCKNPSGYSSLDNWYGYSKELKGIAFVRDEFTELSLITNLDSKRGPAYRKIKYIEADNIDNWCSYIHGCFFVIHGKYGLAELWKTTRTKKWSRVNSWTIPQGIPLTEMWKSYPAFLNDDVLFETPSGYLLKANNKTHVVKVISKGNTAWTNDKPELGEYISSNQMPSISPNGKYVAWHPSSVADNSIKISKMDGSSNKNYKAVYGFAARVDWLDDRYLVCEENQSLSGMSRIFILDTNKNESTCVLNDVERGQWCIIYPTKKKETMIIP